MKLKNEKIKKAKKEYDDCINAAYKQDEIYEAALEAAGCFVCSVWNFGTNNYQCCKDVPVCKAVVNAYKKKTELTKETKQADKKYAKVIFEVLSEIKPKLRARTTKKVVEWDDIFPESFKDVPEILVGNLVELVESDGTLYSFKNLKAI